MRTQLLDALLPTQCFVCAQRLQLRQRWGMCAQCWLSIRPSRTKRTLTGIDRCVVAVTYEGVAREVVLRSKQPYGEHWFPWMATLLWRASRQQLPSDDPIVVPVPSHPRRNLLRGYSPSRLLALALADRAALPHRVALRRSWLDSGRRKLNREQRQRRRHVSGRGRPLTGQTVILVDDVAVTGATLRKCAQECRNLGARRVEGWVWASAD